MSPVVPCYERQGVRETNSRTEVHVVRYRRWMECVTWLFFLEGVVQTESFPCHALPVCEVQDCGTRREYEGH